MATAEIGTRELFSAYPIVLAAAAGAIIARRGRPTAGRGRGAPGGAFRLAARRRLRCRGCVHRAGLLPGRTAARDEQSVDYFPDYPRWIAIAADAKHHWPIGDPSVAGEPLPYHYFVNIHMAAASQVTGLDLSVCLLPAVHPAARRFSWCSSWSWRAGASPAAPTPGLIAACLVFFIGELRLDTRESFLAQTAVPRPLVHLHVPEPELSPRTRHVRAADHPARRAAWRTETARLESRRGCSSRHTSWSAPPTPRSTILPWCSARSSCTARDGLDHEAPGARRRSSIAAGLVLLVSADGLRCSSTGGIRAGSSWTPSSISM